MTVAIPLRRNRPTRGDGLDVMRTHVPATDQQSLHGVALTTPIRTVVDCARSGDRLSAASIIESAIRQELIDRSDVAARIESMPRARGVVAARSALAVADPTSESPLETAVRLLLLDAGLPQPVLQLRCRAGAINCRIDLAYPAALLGAPPGGRYVGLAVEADGHEVHSERATFDHDRVRQTALEEAGWLVRRFTDRHVREQPAYVVGVVERAIAAVRAG